MYAMDRVVHTEHSSEPRRARREAWRLRWSTPLPTGAAPVAESTDDRDVVTPAVFDFTD